MGLIELGALERRLSELLGAAVDLIPAAALRPDLRDRVLAEAVALRPGPRRNRCAKCGPTSP